MARDILVTSALPYANGDTHLGHMLEYIQTDIWVRFQRLRGHNCIYVCGDDAHGTPIMLKARAQNISPEELIEKVSSERQRDFKDFHIEFDQYYTTHSEENRQLANQIYNTLNERGYISRHTISQAYDPESRMFLPDRFIRGECPSCGAAEQYGDSCEVCSATYRPTELGNPVSMISGAKPVEKDSEHYFFKLAEFSDFLRDWMSRGRLQESMTHKLEEWFGIGLRDWDISRDEPYFGFQIPGTTDKYFYVWLDAPIGYMAAFSKLCSQRDDLNFDDFWGPDSQAELHHFIGKDIVYFHALFWPAMLQGAGYRTPDSIQAHGFVTVNGEKMSKSRGTFIKARTWLEHINPEFLRYYFAAKLSHRVEDLDLNFDDFLARVNSDLVGKYVNIASRCANFITKRFDGRLAEQLDNPELVERFVQAGQTIAEHYEQRHFALAMRTVMGLADEANAYIAERAPWQIAKQSGREDELQQICTTAIELFRQLTIYLKPVLPATAERAEAFLQIAPLSWANLDQPLLNHVIAKFKPLLRRVEQPAIDRMIEQSKEDLKAQAPAHDKTAQTDQANATDEQDATISIDDFARIDLRVARVIRADHVEGADKLLELTLDVGPLGQRQVFAGIKAAYDPASLTDRLVCLVANLAPRKMRFGISEGMVMAAGNPAHLLAPDAGAQPGDKIT